MFPSMRHEEVIYQNPFLCMRVWQMDRMMSSQEEVRQCGQPDMPRSRDAINWHYHEEVEFLLVQAGELTVHLPDEVLVMREGDVAIFGSSEPHSTYQSAPGQLAQTVLQLDLQKHIDQSTVSNLKYFSEVLRPLSKLNYIFRDNPDVRRQAQGYILAIYEEMQRKEPGYELAVSALIKNMLLILLRNDDRQQLQSNEDPLLERVMPALTYIDQNLSDKIMIQDVAHQVNMSYYYFVKLFKRALGMSFTDYVNFKRIKRAEQLLLTEDLSVVEVAEQVGIFNLGHFYEMFKRINGCSPRQFKNRLEDLR